VHIRIYQMLNFYEKLIYFLLFGLNYKQKIIKNYLNAKRNINLLESFNSIKTNIIHQIVKQKNLNKLILVCNFDHTNNFKQFLISKFLMNKFFNAVLLNCILNKKKFIFPLPTTVLKIITKKVKVNFFLSNVTWIVLCFFMFFTKIIFFLKIILNKNVKRGDSNSACIYLDSLPRINHTEFEFFNIIINNLKLKKDIIFYHNNEKIINNKFRLRYKKHNYSTFYIKSVLQLAMFQMSIFERLYFFLSIIIKILSKKNFLNNLVFFENIFEYALFQKNQFIFDYCFFNNPKIISKPSWTEYNESKKNNSVIFYFYSINMFPLIRKKVEKYPYVGGHFCSTWKIFWIWNVGQLNWLKSNVKSSFSHRFISPFSMEGSNINISSYSNKKIITIFDVPPKKLFTISQLVNPYNHYSFNYCIKFLKDIIYNPAIKNNNIFLKIKRDYSNIDLRYRSFLKKISEKKNVRIYYEEISATSLIKNSNLVISIPFTTPALIAKFFHKKSFYYDPYFPLKKSKFYPEGVEIVNSKKKLKIILEKLN